MPDTPWQREEDKRYQSNYETVKKIADLFGLQMLGFNPNWSFELKYSMDLSYEISDDFMSKVAVSLGYKWNFNNDIHTDIEKQEEWVNQLNLRLENAKKVASETNEKIKQYPEDDVKKDVTKNLESNSKYHEKSLLEANGRLSKLKKVVGIRNDLIEKGKSKF
jgi:uncharacterized protein YggL (DUF469 family)